ncbi:MAG: YqaA family protein [Terriglobia bacterium]
MPHLGSIAHTLGHFLSHHGGWGLFLISYLDSSFLAFPFINDLLLIKFSSLQPHRAFFYALECTTGSVLGAYTIYFLTRKGSRYFSRKTPRREKSRIRTWIEHNDFLSLLIASLLPPPLPFKIFPIIAGGLRTSEARFIMALLIGRGIRFSAESWLGIHYGVAAQRYLRHNIVSISLITIAVIIGIAIVYRRLKRQTIQSI